MMLSRFDMVFVNPRASGPWRKSDPTIFEGAGPARWWPASVASSADENRPGVRGSEIVAAPRRGDAIQSGVLIA